MSVKRPVEYTTGEQRKIEENTAEKRMVVVDHVETNVSNV